MNTNTQENTWAPLPPVAPAKRSHSSGDAWGRGDYSIPALAIAGASCTGDFADSPAPPSEVKPELNALRQFLATQGIKTAIRGATENGLFSAKVWVQARREDFARAFELAEAWLHDNNDTTHHIHDARS